MNWYYIIPLWNKTEGNMFCLVLEKLVLLNANLLPLVLKPTVIYVTKDKKKYKSP